MLCQTCMNDSSRIRVVDGKETCTNCGLVETGGSKIDGSITRNSFRIRQQQKQHQADLTPPWVYNKSKRRGTANPEFIKMFPNQAEKTFTQKELREVGITKLKGKV